MYNNSEKFETIIKRTEEGSIKDICYTIMQSFRVNI